MRKMTVDNQIVQVYVNDTSKDDGGELKNQSLNFMGYNNICNCKCFCFPQQKLYLGF